MLTQERIAEPTPSQTIEPFSIGRTTAGLLVIGHDVIVGRYEQVHRAQWLQKKIEHFKSDSLLIPALAAAQGIVFNDRITHTFNGDGQMEDYSTTGLGRASRELGRVINGSDSWGDLFKKESLHRGEEALLRPEVAGLQEIEYAGEAGKLYFRMVHDIVKPYEAFAGDGYVSLEARQPDDAYKTVDDDDEEADEIAQLCSKSEAHFTEALNTGAKLTEIIADGRVIALQKGAGDHTALLTVPAVLNGVRLPVGSIMTIETNAAGNHKFAFGRLSVFCLETAAAGRREFAAVFSNEQKVMEQGFPPAYDMALARFNKLVGRDAPQEHSNQQVSRNALDEALETAQQDQVAHLLQVTDSTAMELAFIARADYETTVENGKGVELGTDPHHRDTIRQRLITERLSYARNFGQTAVERARKNLDVIKDLSLQLRLGTCGTQLTRLAAVV